MKLKIIKEKREIKPQIVRITKELGIPLIGHIAFGILDRAQNNMIQVRATTICNAHCPFCSTSANDFKIHPTNYVVDIEYLAEEVEKIAKIKGNNLIIFLDSVGEPTTHPQFVQLVQKLRSIKEVKEIIVITNGTLLTLERIKQLEQAGLTRINLSFHSTNPDLAKKLFGIPNYDVEKIISLIKYIKQNTNIDIMLTPVWLPHVNDEEIEKIIKLCKSLNVKIGLQNYETYKYSRKMKEAKKQTYWKFYNQIKSWEKEYNLKLRVTDKDLGIEKRPRIPEIFLIGEKVQAKIKAPGWLPNQMIGVAKNICISINNCNKNVNDLVTVKILQNKNNIYLAE
ncbi:MAG: radical SAM protein [Nanoarchaeota archaeon]